jgi:hypothetical protein
LNEIEFNEYFQLKILTLAYINPLAYLNLLQNSQAILSNSNRSRDKGMSVSFYLDLVMGRKGTGGPLNLHPALSLIAHFAFITFTVQTNYVPAFVAADLLSSDLLAAYPTVKTTLYLFAEKVSEFL